MNHFDRLPAFVQSLLLVLAFIAVCVLVDSIGGCCASPVEPVTEPVIVPCDTDMDCQIKNPHLGVY